MSKAPRITHPGHCPGCKRKFESDTRVIRTDHGWISCEEHERTFVPESIIFLGRYDEARQL